MGKRGLWFQTAALILLVLGLAGSFLFTVLYVTSANRTQDQRQCELLTDLAVVSGYHARYGHGQENREDFAALHADELRLIRVYRC